MTAHFTDISAGARFSELPGLLERVADRAASLGISADVSLRLQLVTEELFTNTITHGHHGDSEHSVCLALGLSHDVLTLRYEDDAPAFDLSGIGQKPSSTATIGGLGIGLIHGMSKAIRYRRQGPRNITEIDL